MKVLLIWWANCYKCRAIEWFLKERSEKNWYEFEEKDVSTASPEELEWATALPVIWMDNKQIDYDEIINMLSA